jgi:hypothetical protein
MTINKTDASGNWISEDNGMSWTLVEPSTSFLAEQANSVDPPIMQTAEVIAAQAISDEISSRVGEASTIAELKLAITDGLNAALTQLKGE